jgi:hypothetical protein
MANKKKSVKLDEVSQVHGRIDLNNVGSNTPGTLDRLLGESLNIYSATDKDEYLSQLNEMNQTDLQSHAYKVGLIPVDDRKLLVARLVSEYEKWNSTLSPVTSVNSIDASKLSKQVQKILREGA